MKTLLVTGATGVLAKSFISKYAETYNIVEAKREPKSPHEIKLDSWTMENPKTGIDLVIHFAGKYLTDSSIESIKVVHDSVIGTAAVLADYCGTTKTPLIALGSYFEKAPENLQPWSYYSTAKTAAFNIIHNSSKTNKFAFNYVYCFDTFSEDLSRKKIVDVLLDSTTQRLELSEGKQKMNLTHVEDLVEGINLLALSLLEKPEGISEYQIKSEQNEFTLREIAEKINLLRDKKIELVFGAKPYRHKEVFELWDCAPAIPDSSVDRSFDSFIETYLGISHA